MLGYSRWVMAPLQIAAVVSALMAVAPKVAHAALLLPATPFTYDNSDGSPDTILSFVAPGAGTLTFSLLLPAVSGQSITGAFTAIISSPAGQDLNINFVGETYDPSDRVLGLVSFGDVVFNDPLPGTELFVLNGKMVWSALAGPGEYNIDIFSLLSPSFEEPRFAPTIAVDFEAAATAETPLPAALPLFASGLGVLGLLHRRRRKPPTPQA